ncbi:MAG: UvrD-helicase domain-containing protein, partial [Desulfosarcina sp.]|nr:UvrD-helicase domain-containing protein [Desulfobacterales bacterium]
MEPFDIVRNQLTEGACLIEAGAGTGKTYALTAIFLRLLFENQIEPDRILVVTFTTAATAELRDRLRRQLIAVRRFIDGEGPLDDTLRELVERVASPARIRERVVAALREFDRIAIFTIHGFCQRLLTEMAFETGSPFEVELVADPSAWLQEIADDYWREVFFEASPELTAHALDRLRGPETLAHLYQRYRLPDLHVIPVFPDFPPIDFHPYRRHRETLRRQWPGVQTEIATLLKNPGLKGNIYGSLKPAAGPPSGMTKREQKLGAWCRALGYFLRSRTSLFPPCPSLIYFTADKIAASVRKGQTPPLHPFFDQCQEMYDEAARLNVALDQWLAALRYRFFPYADRKLESRKQQRPMMFFDDLLIRVREALDEKRGGDLAATVRKHYQAALVDEFQDTDTIQYQIFKRLFDTADHFLFMIGDPKQAIYGFRGADIFSYLKAARQTRQGYTLLHNWRSTPDLIQAVNTLFESHPRPFLIPEIAFHPAIAARRKITDTGCQPETAPLTVWWIPDGDPAATNTGRRLTKALATDRILDAVAGEVSRLLQPPSNGPEGPRECLPHDIAILVRTNWQARRVKARMTEAGIPAVIHHVGNVFDTREADAFEAVLQAVAQPGDSRKLKTALATRFFGYTGDRLAFTDQTPGWWEDTVQQFYRYHSIWQEIGFYPFFRRMMSENQIAGRLLAFTDGERRLTNLLHLGELLHQAVTQQRTGLQGALKWLGLQKSMLSGSVEEQQLRMESDARALTILTIHKSKGLEFPIVFCPFCWESDPGARDWPLFHDPGADMGPTLALGADTGS